MQRHLKYSIYQNKIIFAPSKVHHFVLSVNITSIYTSPKSKRSYFWFLYHPYFLKSMNPQITWNNFSINISLYAQALPLRPLCLFLRFWQQTCKWSYIQDCFLQMHSLHCRQANSHRSSYSPHLYTTKLILPHSFIDVIDKGETISSTWCGSSSILRPLASSLVSYIIVLFYFLPQI